MAFDAISTPAPDASRLRLILEQTIERALELLDQLDGDSDLEPSLAFQEVRVWESQLAASENAPWGGVDWTDLEAVDEREPEEAI